jgi:hypothetical protein
MTNIWQRKVEELVQWRCDPMPSPRIRKIYNLAIAFLMQQYEKLDSKLYNQFDGMDKIVWTTNIDDIPCENAIGCAELGKTGGIYSMYYGDPRYDIPIMSMEAAHRGIGEYYVEHGFTYPYQRANDDIHYGANVFAKPYCWVYQQGFKILEDWLKFRKATMVPMFFYDLPYIVTQTDRIRAEIKGGTAPRGRNPYWAAMPDSKAKTEVLAWLGHYHTHDDGPGHHHH